MDGRSERQGDKDHNVESIVEPVWLPGQVLYDDLTLTRSIAVTLYPHSKHWVHINKVQLEISWLVNKVIVHETVTKCA